LHINRDFAIFIALSSLFNKTNRERSIMKYPLIALAFLSLTTGCASNSANMMVGNSMSYLSLSDQREASRTVVQYDSVPDEALHLGEVEAARCHRRTDQAPPTEETLVMDLKIAAYAKGADGIADIKINKVSGLNQNCWYVLDGRAQMYTIQSTQ
jgi:hypothetical protein